MAKRKVKRPAKEWVDLFLAVADYIDGGGDGGLFNGEAPGGFVVEAYQALFKSPQGYAIYGEEVEKGSELLRKLSGD